MVFRVESQDKEFFANCRTLEKAKQYALRFAKKYNKVIDVCNTTNKVIYSCDAHEHVISLN